MPPVKEPEVNEAKKTTSGTPVVATKRVPSRAAQKREPATVGVGTTSDGDGETPTTPSPRPGANG